MFTYPYKTKLPEYNASKVSDRVIKSCVKILNNYNIEYTISKEPYYVPDLKPNTIHHNLIFTLSNGTNGTITIQIPDIRNDIIYSKGIKRYVLMQIRDTLLVPINNYIKFLPDIEIFGSISPKLFFLERVGRIPLDNAILAFSKGDAYSDFLKNYNQEMYEGFEEVRKQKPAINKQHKRVIEYLKNLLSVSEVIQKLYLGDFETMIIDALDKLQHEYSKDLDLKDRRLRTVEEIIWSGLVTQFLRLIVENVLRTKKKDLVEVIEPFSTIYNYSLIETQFDSPYASLNNKIRCTILGPGGFGDNVRSEIRNLHDSHYAMLDPVSTPDREKCGVIVFLAYDYDVDDIGRFKVKDKNFMKWEPESEGGAE